MKNKYYLLLLFLISTSALAQDNNNIEREKINNLFYKAVNRNAFKDTTMVYMFAIKVEVYNKKGIINIKSVNASDSSAYLIFTNLDFLKEINYKVFMQKRKNASFIFPVSIILSYPEKPSGSSLIGKDIQDKIEKLWFRTEYANTSTENYIYIPALNLRTTTWYDY
jgi:hypothetical protein